jgi:hypothetical protein
MQVVNTTTSTLSNFRARYFLTAENGKTPIVQDVATPNMDVSVERIASSVWAVNMDYRNATLAPGKRLPASADWDTFEIRYSDSSAMDKSNDYSNPVEATFVSTDRIALYNNAGQLVSGSEPPEAKAPYSIRVRARGTTGNEVINLTVGGVAVASWKLTTALKDYSVSTALGGGINVVFTNDATNRDVQLDYVAINNVVHQAETQATNTAFFSNGKCGGGGRSEWMNCNGYIGFSAYK